MNFTVYTRPGCPYCDQVKQVLSSKGYSFREYVLGNHFEKTQFYSEFGQGATFPQVLMNDTKLGGCTDTVRYLRENNLI